VPYVVTNYISLSWFECRFLYSYPTTTVVG